MDKNNKLVTDLEPNEDLLEKITQNKEKITTKEALKGVIDYVEAH